MWRAMAYDFCQRTLTETIRGGGIGASPSVSFLRQFHLTYSVFRFVARRTSFSIGVPSLESAPVSEKRYTLVPRFENTVTYSSREPSHASRYFRRPGSFCHTLARSWSIRFVTVFTKRGT